MYWGGGRCGHSLSDGAFLDWGSFCFRNGRFSITILFVTLAFIWYNEAIQIAVVVSVVIIVFIVRILVGNVVVARVGLVRVVLGV
jgi:hypothetical protein